MPRYRSYSDNIFIYSLYPFISTYVPINFRIYALLYSYPHNSRSLASLFRISWMFQSPNHQLLSVEEGTLIL